MTDFPIDMCSFTISMDFPYSVVCFAVDFVVVEQLDKLCTTQQQLLSDVTQITDRVLKLEQAFQTDHEALTQVSLLVAT